MQITMAHGAIWLCMVLLVGLGSAADVPFVFDQSTSGVAGYTSAQIEQDHTTSPDLAGVPIVSSPSDNESLEIPITGGGSGSGTQEKNIGELKRTLDARVEPDNPRVRDEAVVLALKYPGEKTIDQIVSIYDYLKNGDESKKGWGYVSDPRGIDDFMFANQTLRNGERANCVGGGDCDDFAILMSALVESIGGTTRIILARNNSTGGHAYTEVYLGRINNSDSGDQVEAIIDWLKEKLDADKIYTHIDTDTKDVWLNLDWGPDEKGSAHPGGPFYQGDKHIVLCIRDAFSRTPLRLPEAPEDEAEQGTSERLEAGNKTIGQTVTESIQEAVSIDQSRVRQQTTSTSGIEVQSWYKTFGGAKDDIGFSVQQTLDGGYIITGFTESFGAGEKDLWLIKTDDQGNKIWDKTFGGAKDDIGYSVQQTTDGGYMIMGDTASFGVIYGNLWLIKTDEQGNKLWERRFVGQGHGFDSVQQPLDGGYIITGWTSSFGVHGIDLWLIKTDDQGNVLLNRSIDKSGYSGQGNSVQQTLDGGYIITGRIRSAEGSGTDLWLIKTDDQGNMLWDRTYGERGFDEGASVQQTSDGGYIITGEKRSFEAVNSDLWLIKTDDQGNKLWDRTFSGDGYGGEGRSVQQTLDGGYIIMGKSYVEDTDDLWLIKTDANGNKLWDRTFSTANFYQFSSVQQTHDGGYIITGITGFSEGYDWDLCLIKTDAEGNV